MPEKGQPRKQESNPITPTRMAETVPYQTPDQHSFLLQAVFEIRGAVGELKQITTTLTDQTKHHEDKIDQIGRDVHAAKVTVMVVGAIVAATAAFLGWAITTLLPYLSHASAK